MGIPGEKYSSKYEKQKSIKLEAGGLFITVIFSLTDAGSCHGKDITGAVAINQFHLICIALLTECSNPSCAAATSSQADNL